MKHYCTHPQQRIYTHIYLQKHVVATATSAVQTTGSTETVSPTGSAGTTEPSTSVETTSMESTSEGTFTFHIITVYSLLNLMFIIA